jgi:DNA-binding transcriptional MerR regulator
MVAPPDTPPKAHTPGSKKDPSPKEEGANGAHERSTSESGLLTRDESAQLLGVAVQTIRNYERKGLLHPLRILRRCNGRDRLVIVHDPRELLKARKKLQDQPQSKDAIDTSTWLTRNESTDMLSISTQTLKNYEQRGMLHPLRVPRRDARGHEQHVVVYDPKELLKLPRGIGRPFISPREPGEIDARCYEMFDQGKTFREIVIALRQTSDNVRMLHERWLDDRGADMVITAEAKEALEAVVGPFTDVTELVMLVAKLVKSSCQ